MRRDEVELSHRGESLGHGQCTRGLRLLGVLALLMLHACRFGYDELVQDADSLEGQDPGRDAGIVDDLEDAQATVDAAVQADAGQADEPASDAGEADVPCTSDSSCTCSSYGGHDYRLCATPLPFSEARTQCALHGMELARIDDAAENAWLASSGAEILAGRFAYLGATDIVEEGTWRWVAGDDAFWLGEADGTAVVGVYQNWSAKKPFGNATRNCAGMRSDGTWEDRSCTAETPYFCESL